VAGHGWYWVTDAIERYSPGNTDPNGRWGDFVEVGHIDASRTWKIGLPDERAGGTSAGFSVTAKNVFWWALDWDFNSEEETDFRIHAIGLDGRMKVNHPAARHVVRRKRDDACAESWVEQGLEAGEESPGAV
jgi:hypothetical protein